MLAAPFLSVYDVLENNRVQTGIAKDMSDISFFVELVHLAYFIGIVIAIVVLVMIIQIICRPKQELTRKEFWGGVGVGGLSILYILPMCWLLYAVPSYWKVIIYMVLDIIGNAE